MVEEIHRLRRGDRFALTGLQGDYQSGTRWLLLDSISVPGALQFRMKFRDGSVERVVLTSIPLSEFRAMREEGIIAGPFHGEISEDEWTASG